MTQERRCPQCGAELAASAAEQPCPACLMKLGLESWAERRQSPPTAGYSGAFAAPDPAELARQLPHFEILELLGAGGMGAVYRVRQRSLDRIVALKIISPKIAGDAGFAERFAREAKTLARLAHPNIVTIHDFGQANELYYLVMEYVDGVNLRQLLGAGQMAPRQALDIVPPICDALQYAHDENIVHRDIKPENILIDKRGRVKIADFGLAKLMTPDVSQLALTATHQVMGTPRYMAPEQMKGAHDVDHRADIYSLGVIFYEMLTGEVPVGHFALPSKKVQVDVRLDEIVLRALESEPEKRYQRASAVKTDVEAVATTDALSSSPGLDVALSVTATESAAQRLLPAARALFLVGLAGILAAVVLIVWSALTLSRIYAAPAEPQKTVSKEGGAGAASTQTVTVQPHAWRPYVGWFWALLVEQVVALALSVLTLAASLWMSRLEFRSLAAGVAVLALVPLSVLWPVTLPVGLWVLLVLNRSGVRQAFAAAAPEPSRTAPALLQTWTLTTTIGLILAVAALASSLLPWIWLSIFGIHTTAIGIDHWQGSVVCVCGIACAIAVAAIDLYAARAVWRAIASLVAGVAIATVCGQIIVQLSDAPRFTSTSSGSAEFAKLAEDLVTSMLLNSIRHETAFGVYAAGVTGILLTLFGIWQFCVFAVGRRRAAQG